MRPSRPSEQTKADVVLAASRMGIAPGNVSFSHRLEWISIDGRLALRQARCDPNSGRVTLWLDAIKGDAVAVLKSCLASGLMVREWDESEHPRDGDGKFTDAGGDASGGGNETEAHGAGERDRPIVVAAADSEQRNAIDSGLSAVPKDHLDVIKDVEVEGFKDFDRISTMPGLTGFFGYRNEKPLIAIAKTISFYGADAKRYSVAVSNPSNVLVHEVGHALDRASNNKMSKKIGRAVIDEAFFGKLSSGWADSYGKGKNILDAIPGSQYYLAKESEAFAELYALNYGPEDKASFFGMDRPLAQLVFQDSLKKLRTMKLEDYVELK